MTGQGMVVTSQEGIVMPQGCCKSTATAEAALRQEMALQPQLFLLFLKFSALLSALALGKHPAHSSCPAPDNSRMAQVLRNTFPFGTGEWDTGNQNTMDSQAAGSHTSEVTTRLSTGKLSPCPEGALGPLLRWSPPTRLQHECPEHSSNPDMHNVYNVSRHLAEGIL